MDPNTDIFARMAEAGLPADNLTTRKAALPAPTRDLHGRIIAAIAATGQAPDTAQVQAWAQTLGVDAPTALTDLAAAELIFTDSPADSRTPHVTGGVPFAADGISPTGCVLLADRSSPRTAPSTPWESGPCSEPTAT